MTAITDADHKSPYPGPTSMLGVLCVQGETSPRAVGVSLPDADARLAGDLSPRHALVAAATLAELSGEHGLSLALREAAHRQP